MDWQTFLTILLAVLSGYLGLKNYQMSQRKEDQRESIEMTKVQVQLNQVMGMLRDLQKDAQSTNADFRILLERVVVAEQKLGEAYNRIKKLEESHGN